MLDRVHHLFIWMYLAFASGATYRLFKAGDEYAESASNNQSPFYLATWILLYLLLIFYVCQNACGERSVLLRAKSVLAFFAALLLASLTGFSPVASITKVVMLALTALFGFHLCARNGMHNAMRLVLVTIVMLNAVNLAIIFLPENQWAYHKISAIGDSQTGFRGFFPHKNLLGLLTAIGLLLMTSYWPRTLPFWTRVAATAIMLMVLVEANSANAIISLCAGMSVFVILQVPMSWRMISVMFLIAVAVCSFVFVDDPLQKILAMLNKDLTMTGRTGVWYHFLSFFLERPFLGYGYFAFFGDEMSVAATRFSSLLPLDYMPPHIHNLYLQAALDGGALACFSLLVIIVRTAAFYLMAGVGDAREKHVGISAMATVSVAGLGDVPLIHNSLITIVFFMLVANSYVAGRRSTGLRGEENTEDEGCRWVDPDFGDPSHTPGRHWAMSPNAARECRPSLGDAARRPPGTERWA